MKTKRPKPEQKAAAAKLVGLPFAAGTLAIATRICELRDLAPPANKADAGGIILEFLKKPQIETPLPAEERDVFLEALERK